MKTKTTKSWYDVLYPDGKNGKIRATSRREAYIKAFKKLTKEEQKKIVADIDKQYEKQESQKKELTAVKAE